MPTQAILGQELRLFCSTTSSINTSTDAVEQFRDFSYARSYEQEDLTNSDSDQGYRDNIDTFKDNSATFELIVDSAEPTVQSRLYDAAESGATHYFEVHPFGTAAGRRKDTFEAQVRITSEPYPTTQNVKQSIELNIRGAVTRGVQ